MAKDPAILFYTSDFIIGTLTMTWAEKGQYITVLCIMHQNGRLTKSQIDNVLRGETIPSVLEKFEIDDKGLYYNSRLEEEKKKRTSFAESRRKSLDINNGDMVHIYVLFDPESRNYKIGSSKYPMLRLNDMLKKNPYVIMFWKTPQLVERVNEKKLHDYFIDKKVKNDWFKLNEKDIDYIKEYFRTEVRTVNENVNENVIVNKDLNKGGAGGKIPWTVVYPFDSTEFKNLWEQWKQHLVEIKKPYHTFSSEQAALQYLGGYTEPEAIEMIKQSIRNNWKNLREIEKNGKQKSTNDRQERISSVNNLENLALKVLGGDQSNDG